jgi:hypothetical protein
LSSAAGYAPQAEKVVDNVYVIFGLLDQRNPENDVHINLGGVELNTRCIDTHFPGNRMAWLPQRG